MRALSGAGGIRLAVASIASLRMVFGSGPVLTQPPAGEGLKPDVRGDATDCVAGAAITLAMGAGFGCWWLAIGGSAAFSRAYSRKSRCCSEVRGIPASVFERAH